MKLSVLFLLLVLLSNPTSADTVRFKHYTRTQNLSQNVINDIAQDAQGFLWFATQNGLNRFDGVSFENFIVTNDNNSNTLSANYIRSLYFQDPYYLWIGYDTEGISRFNLKSGKIENIDLSTPFGSHKANVIRKIIGCNDDIWVASLAGITIIDKQNAIIKDQQVFSKNMPSLAINTVFKNDLGRCLVGTSQGLFELNNNLYTSLIKDIHITAIAQSRDGLYWFGTNQGIYTSNGKKAGEISISLSSNKLPDFYITDISETPTGDMWIATRTSGIFIYSKKNKDWQRLQHKNSAPSSLINNNINKIFVDNVENLWVATSGGGLSQYNTSKADLGHINDESFDVAFNNDVRALSVDDNGYVWIGTNKGLFRWHKASNELLNSKQLGLPEHFSRQFITFIHRDKNNFIWIGTLNSGLYKGFLGSKDFEQYKPVSGDNQSFPGNRPITIFEDSTNDIWIGTFHNGLARYLPNKNKFTRFQQGKGLNQISHNKVTAIAEDNHGRIWLASHGEGLSILDKTSLKVEKITKSSHDIADDVINSIQKDQYGRMWLATDLGLTLFDYDQNFIKNFTSGVGFTGNILYSLQLDKQNNLWIGTNNGMLKFNTKTFIAEVFSEQDGIQHLEFNTTAKTIDKSGRIYLGGLNGFNQFDPQTVKAEIRTPKVELNQFFLQNKRLESQASLATSPLSNRASYSDKISIRTTDLLDIGFSAFNIKNPENINFYYRLLPLDKEWYLAQKGRNLASYYRLSEGEYQFELRATYNHNKNISDTKSFAVSVVAPWWQTQGAYTIYLTVVLLVLLMFLLLIYRKRQIELIHYKQINESRQRLSLALWGSGDSIWHWDINKNIIVRESFSRDNVSSISNPFSIENLSEFIHPDDINRVKLNLIKALSGEVSLYQVDYRLKTAKDQWLWVLDRGQVNEYDENNKATDIVGTTQDISRLKEAQNELYQLNHDLEKRVQSRTHDIERSNKELEATIQQLNKTKDKLVQMEKMSALTNLVCGIAHEINTPLSIVKTSLTCIQEENLALTDALDSGKLSRDRFTKYKEKYPHAHKLCTDNINRSIKLIDEFKRISISEKDYKFEKVNLSDLVDKMIKEYEGDHSTTLVTFVSSLPNGIFIHSSKQAIEDIFCELINNSLKHAFQLCLPDNNYITIELVEHNNEFTTLQYKDNGCGLDPDTIAHVFEPFNCNCLSTEGLGLGLNMTYNIITSILEGEIQQLDVNTGTCFKLILKNDFSNI